VFDERLDLGFQIAGQEVILQHDAVFERLVPALDLILRLWTERSAANVAHRFVKTVGISFLTQWDSMAAFRMAARLVDRPE